MSVNVPPVPAPPEGRRAPSASPIEADNPGRAMVQLYWIPLGAGTPVVQASGRIFERLAAWWHGRSARDLYHAALQVWTTQGRFAIEQAPVPDRNGAARGVVAEGPVGLRIAGRLRRFRYEVRCWPDGTIPDLDRAVGGPVCVSTDEDVAKRIIEVLPGVPTAVWGRDEVGAGDMWNSNSVLSWALTRSGVDTDGLRPPAGGRAPGWAAGRLVAAGCCSPGAGKRHRSVRSSRGGSTMAGRGTTEASSFGTGAGSPCRCCASSQPPGSPAS